MAVQIPDYFPQWLTDLVLGHFPEGDPDAMRRSADGWSDAANALVPVLHRLRVASEQLAKAVEGETGAAMREQYGKVIDHTQAQIEFNNAMAEQLYENATAIEYQQYVLVGIAGALLAQVIMIWRCLRRAASSRRSPIAPRRKRGWNSPGATWC
ncbi:WXG100 family type VII secretion target [Nocardia asiatica]|uniref:WXG100 family type VII secretion target n=1 Tax=Nocardia asiatica TaxID=209252 RepID=UPI003EE3C2D7